MHSFFQFFRRFCNKNTQQGEKCDFVQRVFLYMYVISIYVCIKIIVCFKLNDLKRCRRFLFSFFSPLFIQDLSPKHVPFEKFFGRMGLCTREIVLTVDRKHKSLFYQGEKHRTKSRRDNKMGLSFLLYMQKVISYRNKCLLSNIASILLNTSDNHESVISRQ